MNTKSLIDITKVKINEYEDFFPGHVDGIQFYLGNNNGLVHSWTDTNVINGHRYFYAVTAYDHGSIEKEMLFENDKEIKR